MPNLTFDLSDILGADYDPRRTKVWIETNIDGDVIVDATGGKIHLGDATATVGADGTGAFTGLIGTNEATNPTQFQYQVWIDYPERSSGKRTKWASGWFSLIANSDLSGMVAEAFVPPTWASATTDQITANVTANVQPLTDAAQASADAAAASATQASSVAGISTSDGLVKTIVTDPASATRGALNAAYVGAVVMAGPGIDPTGATDSTAAIQAKFDSLPASGGLVAFPAGAFKVSSLTCSKPVTIMGAGGSLKGDGGLSPIRALTTLVSTATTGDCLTLSAIGTNVRDLAVVNEASTAPTAGTGIKWTGTSQGVMDRVTVLGFWNNVETNGVYWMMNACHLYDPINYGLYANNQGAAYSDHGDFGVVNSVISCMYRTNNPVAGVQWEAGGGIRFVGNKINAGTQPGNSSPGRFQYGFRINAVPGVATGDCVIQSNSIANCSTALVRITQTGSGSFIAANVTGNQINVGTGTCIGVWIGAATVATINQIRDMMVADNVFHDLGGPSVVVDYATGVVVGKNEHYNVASPVVRLGDGATTQAAPISVSVEPQHVRSPNITLLEDWRSYGNNDDLDGNVAHDYQRQWHESVVNNDQAMFRVGVRSNGAVLARVQVSGYNWSSGRNFVIEQVRAITRAGSGNVAVSTVGTDTAVGTAAPDVAVTYDTTTNAGELTLKAKVTNASFPNADAQVRVTLQGAVSKVRKGA